VVDEIDEGRFYRTSSVKIRQIGCMHLKPEESGDRTRGNTGEACYVQSQDRVGVSWCCSLEQRKVRHGAGKDMGRSHTERPSFLFVC
jgi:hypothetical protein